MKVSSVIGLVVAIAGLYLGAAMEGSNPMAVLNPSAMLIVLGGTLGAVIMRHELRRHQEHPEAVHEGVQRRRRRTSTRRSPSSSATPRPPAATACWPSTRSRRTIEDPFTKKGLQLVVDGTDPDLVADILEAENDAMRKRHAASRAAVRQGRRLRPDDGHHRHRLRPDPRARQPRQARDARPVDLRRVHRDAARRRLRQRRLPPDRRAPEAALPGGAARPRADRRGHPLDPGRRQPARRPGEAHHLRPARPAPVEAEQAAGARLPRRRPRRPSWPAQAS